MSQVRRRGHQRALPLMTLLTLSMIVFVAFWSGGQAPMQPMPAGAGDPVRPDRLRADLDGDGADEFLAPYDAYRWNNGVGMVRVMRAGGVAALQLASGQVDDRFGYDAAFTPDFSGDGVPEVLVGAPLGFSGEVQTGRAYLFSGADGAMLRTWADEPNSKFGKSVAFVGDVNGDAVGDLAVGGFLLTDAGEPYGTLHLISGADGVVFRTIVGEQVDDAFGHTVAGIDDVSGDGIGDLVVSASLTANAGGTRGRVYVFAGAGADAVPGVHGAEEALAIIPNTSSSNARFGRWLLTDADFDGDGVTGLAIVSERHVADGSIEAEILGWDGVDSPLSVYEGAIVDDAIDAPLAPREMLLAGESDALGVATARVLTAVAPAPLTGDMDGDGDVDADDLDDLLQALEDGDPSGDMDGDGDLDASDLSSGLRRMVGLESGDENATVSSDDDRVADFDEPASSVEPPSEGDPCDEDPTFDGFLTPDCEEEEPPNGGGGLGGAPPVVSNSGGYTDDPPEPDSEPEGDPDGGGGSGGGGGGGGSVASDYLDKETNGRYSESYQPRMEQDPARNHGAASMSCNPVMLATGVKREYESDPLVSLPGRDFELVRRYDSSMVEHDEHRPWMIGGGWATSGDGWLEWRDARFGVLAAQNHEDFVAEWDNDAQYDPTQAHVRITRFPDETGSLFLAERSHAENKNLIEGFYEPTYYTPYLPTAASVRKGSYTVGGSAVDVWVYERAGEGQVLYYNTSGHSDPEFQALDGRVVHERDEFGNIWSYTYVVSTLASGGDAEPRVKRIYLNGTTQSSALAYVEFTYDEGASAADPGTGQLTEAKVYRKSGVDWIVTQYVKYTYAGDLPTYAHLSEDPKSLVLVESGVRVNAPAANETSSEAPEYHARVTHYRYGEIDETVYLTHTYYPEQVEYFAEHHAALPETGNTQTEALVTAAEELSLLPETSEFSVNALASKIVSYYGNESMHEAGYTAGQLKGRVRSELLQNGCGCSGSNGQAVRIDFEYARRLITDHQLTYKKYEQISDGDGLDLVDATREVGRWSRVTVRKEYAIGDSGAWELQRRTRTWSEDRLFGLGWVTYHDPNPDGQQAGALAQITYFNWLPVPLTVANEVTEFKVDENGVEHEGSSWRSFFEFEDHVPDNSEFEDYHWVRSYGPSAVESFELDSNGLLVYDGIYDPDDDNPANPVEAVRFRDKGLVEWQEVDALGRVLKRGVARVENPDPNSPVSLADSQQTQQINYLVTADNLNAVTGGSPRTDLVASESRLPGAGSPAVTTSYEYGLIFRPGMRRQSLLWMQTVQARENVAQFGPDDGLQAVTTVSYTGEGLPEYSQAPDGSLTHTQYDPATGAPTQVARNAALPSGAPGPFIPDRSSDGGELVSTTVVDVLGRPIEQTDELGRTTTIEYGLAPAKTHADAPGSPTLTAVEDTRLPYLHVVTTPHSFEDADGETRYVGPEVHEWGNAAYNQMQTSAFVAGAATPEERSRTLHTYSLSGKLIETRVWHDLDDELDGSYATTFGYDRLGRENEVTDPNGETIRKVYDARDRVIETYRGVLTDQGYLEERLERTYYDYPLTSADAPEQGVGEGNPTLIETWLSDSEVRRTVNVFDWRNRKRLSYVAADTSASIDSTDVLWQADNGAYTATIYDNLDRPVEQAVFSGGDMMSTLGAALIDDSLPSFGDYLGGSSHPDKPILESITEIAYSDRGLVYQTTTRVDPNDADVPRLSRTWYDDAGRTLVSADARGPVTKTEYDGLGRVERSIVTDGASVRAAATPSFVEATTLDTTETSPDTVYEETEPVYIGALEVRTKSSFRAHDATTPGLGENAITLYSDVAYDGAKRPVAHVNHGTGTAGFAPGLEPPIVQESTIPNITDPNTIVTRLRYDEIGRNHETVDALGRVARTYFDDLDRVIGTIENVRDDADGDRIDLVVDEDGYREVVNRPVPEEPEGSDENLVTTMAYDGAGNVIRRIAHRPDGTRQIMAYVYNRDGLSDYPLTVDEFDNPPFSNNLLYEIRYPQTHSSHVGEPAASDEFHFGDTVAFTYNRAGEQIAKLDQDYVYREQRRDPSGRILNEVARLRIQQSDEHPIEEAAGAIVTDYDRFGRVESASMHDVEGTDGFHDVARNAMTYTRDALGRVTTIKHTHKPYGEPAVSWDVEYEYAPLSSELPVSRLTAIVYPTVTAEGQTRVEYDYGAEGSADDRLSRIRGFAWGDPDSFLETQSVSHDYVGLNRRVVSGYFGGGALQVQRNRHTDPDSGVSTPGVYAGLDRFGRVVRNAWSVGVFEPQHRPPLLDVAYEYDDAGNILSRRDARFGAARPDADEFYVYDKFDRLTASIRGDAMAPALRSEEWTLDHQGNWTTHALESSGDGVFDDAERKTREHNDTNEVEAIVDSAGQSLAYDYDDRGAIRAEPLPPDLDASGNVVMERRRRHTRDLYGRLVRIVEQSKALGETTWTDGATVVEYTWHAGNQLATRSADEDGDGVLETTTVYIYDSDWNLLEEIVWVDETALTLTNDDLVRQHIWDPVSHNELVQMRSMQRDGSGAYSIPFPAWAATDRRRDVVAMRYDLSGIQSGHARVRYSPYGVPEPVLVGDLDRDRRRSVRATAHPPRTVPMSITNRYRTSPRFMRS